MLSRRVFLSAAPAAALSSPACRAAASVPAGFGAFLHGLRAEGLRDGIRPDILDAALAGVTPNGHILELDRHQPEFSLTWAQYRARVLPASRLQAGAQSYERNAALFGQVQQRFGVDPRIIIGIWGLESGFGAKTGGFGVVEALATLAYDGRRASYFRTELMNSLRILNDGDITPRGMTGSWAGAMGQPQFMPSSYLHYAVDFDGDGKRDIWTSLPDIFGSVANYLAKCGWRSGEPWGQAVQIPASYAGPSDRDRVRTLGEWEASGVRRIDGSRFSRADIRGALVLPDGAGGEAFMVYPNFHVIRRYNPSDYYALAVGLLGNASL
jgi:membrane-bound lytic murein transglycosylase B